MDLYPVSSAETSFFPPTEAARLLLSEGSQVAGGSTETGNQASSVSFETPKPVSFLQK